MKRERWLSGMTALVLSFGALSGCSRSGIQPATDASGNPVPAASGQPAPIAVTDEWIHQNANGVAGTDARKMDFTGLSPADLANLTYDTETRWPDPSLLPAGFDPQKVLAQGQDPGLGLKALHAQGITGQGVQVAVIDKYILPTHEEFAGRIDYVKVYPSAENGTYVNFHGMAAADIFVGAKVGVAPGAYLHYYAIPDDRNGFGNYVAALDQLLKRNATLPMAQRIRVVSVSWGPTGAKNKTAWDDLLTKAVEQGVAVVYATTYPSFIVTNLLPGGDPNDAGAYRQARSLGGDVQVLGVPGGNKVTASGAGNAVYVHWGEGGQSWAIPYMAGLLTLGLQVKPDASVVDMYRAMEETAVTNALGTHMVNPAAYVAALRGK